MSVRKIDGVSAVALVYLSLSLGLYLAFFIALPLSILASLWWAITLFFFVRSVDITGGLSPMRWGVLGVLSLAWLATAGLVAPFVFLGDWIKHFAVLNLLRDCLWPPTLPGIEIADLESIKGGVPLSPAVLHYYVGWQLIPGALAKASDAITDLPVLLVWSLIGIAVGFSLIFHDETSVGRLALKVGVVIFFSTPDLLGYWLLPQTPYWPRPIMEWWSGSALFQYSSMTTLIQGPIQHTIPSLILIGLLLGPSGGALVRYCALLFASAALWSPFAAIGALPILAFVVVRTQAWRELFSVWNVIGGGLFAVSLAVYFLSGTIGSVPAMFTWMYGGIPSLGLPPFNWSALLAFLLIEVVVTSAVLIPASRNHPQRSFLLLAFALLLVIPLYRIGFANDWTTRVSIPSLIILAKVTADILVDKGPRFARGAVAILFLIGTVTPVTEIYENSAINRVAGSIETLPNREGLKISEIFGEAEPIRSDIKSQLFSFEQSRWTNRAKVCLPAGLTSGTTVRGPDLQTYFGSKNGWGQSETWGLWSVGTDALAPLPAYARDFPNGVVVSVESIAFTEKNHTQEVKVFVNEKLIETWKFSGAIAPQTKTISLPVADLANDRPLLLRFEIPTAVSPRELGMGADDRRLGIGIAAINLSSR